MIKRVFLRVYSFMRNAYSKYNHAIFICIRGRTVLALLRIYIIPECFAWLDWAYEVGPLLALLHIFYPPWIHCEDGRANFPGSEIIVQWAHLSSYPGSEIIIQCARLYSHEPTVLALRWARLPSYPGSEMIVQCARLSSLAPTILAQTLYNVLAYPLMSQLSYLRDDCTMCSPVLSWANCPDSEMCSPILLSWLQDDCTMCLPILLSWLVDDLQWARLSSHLGQLCLNQHKLNHDGHNHIKVYNKYIFIKKSICLKIYHIISVTNIFLWKQNKARLFLSITLTVKCTMYIVHKAGPFAKQGGCDYFVIRWTFL